MDAPDPFLTMMYSSPVLTKLLPFTASTAVYVTATPVRDESVSGRLVLGNFVHSLFTNYLPSKRAGAYINDLPPFL